MGPGDFFGELALLGKIPRTATATAATPARLLVVGHREFTTLLTSHPAIQDQILKAVAGWIAYADARSPALIRRQGPVSTAPVRPSAGVMRTATAVGLSA